MAYHVALRRMPGADGMTLARATDGRKSRFIFRCGGVDWSPAANLDGLTINDARHALPGSSRRPERG